MLAQIADLRLCALMSWCPYVGFRARPHECGLMSNVINVLPPHRDGAVPYPMGMGRNGRTDLPRGSTKRSPPLSLTVFSLGCPLTSHNWAAPLLIDRTSLRRLLILTLLLISGNVHLNPGPISNHPRPRYPCSISHLDVGRDSFQCSACLKWVHFL